VPRPPADYRLVHATADKIEARMARAFVRAADRMRENVSVFELGNALADGDVKRAVRAVSPGGQIEDALGPVATITRDAVIRGGRIGAQMVREAK